MNHIRRSRFSSWCSALNPFRPKQDMAKSDDLHEKDANDFMCDGRFGGNSGSFRVIVRFFDEQDAEVKTDR